MIKPVQKDLYAVIGNPVSHSLSPVMMNHAFEALGYGACYLALEVTELEQDLAVLHQMGLKGLSVTIPHKQTILRHCERLDVTARTIGAVNTLKRTVDGWEGCNTDWLGVVRPLQAVASIKDRKALIIGAGGAARAAAYGLIREGARVAITNRTESKGVELAEDLGCDFVPLNQVCGDEYEIVVQCTSVGMRGIAARNLVPEDFFAPNMTVMDLVYRPLWTPFLQAARRVGCSLVTGLEILLEQGMAQLEWWINRPAPGNVMRSALETALQGEENA